MAAAPSLNQVYISESVLSKGAQLLLKTATFYLIPSPGLSLLYPLRHTAAHLHESFPERSRGPAEAGEVRWRAARHYLPSPAFRETGRRRPPVEEHRHALSTGGGPPFLMHCLPAALSLSVEKEEAEWNESAALRAIKMIRCNHTAYTPVEGCVWPRRIRVVCL